MLWALAAAGGSPAAPVGGLRDLWEAVVDELGGRGDAGDRSMARAFWLHAVTKTTLERGRPYDIFSEPL